MSDHEVRFAAEFGRSVNRWDWWNLKKEHTPFQWALQMVLYRVEPYGERRADMRAAHNSVNLMIAQHVGDPIADEQVMEMREHLQRYIKDADDYEEESDLKAVELLKRKQQCPASAT